MNLLELISQYRNNRKILLLIVYIALFLDNMLLTTVGGQIPLDISKNLILVPIIPEYLLRLDHPNDTEFLLHNEPMVDMEVRVKRVALSDYVSRVVSTKK